MSATRYAVMMLRFARMMGVRGFNRVLELPRVGYAVGLWVERSERATVRLDPSKLSES
jgi:hypothetical protein